MIHRYELLLALAVALFALGLAAFYRWATSPARRYAVTVVVVCAVATVHYE